MVNAELVGLCWQVGECLSKKLASAEWPDGVVADLAATIARKHRGRRGFTSRTLFRMRQFYETYRKADNGSPLVSQLPQSYHLIILSGAKLPEEREFYVHAAIRGRPRP